MMSLDKLFPLSCTSRAIRIKWPSLSQAIGTNQDHLGNRDPEYCCQGLTCDLTTLTLHALLRYSESRFHMQGDSGYILTENSNKQTNKKLQQQYQQKKCFTAYIRLLRSLLTIIYFQHPSPFMQVTALVCGVVFSSIESCMTNPPSQAFISVKQWEDLQQRHH